MMLYNEKLCYLACILWNMRSIRIIKDYDIEAKRICIWRSTVYQQRNEKLKIKLKLSPNLSVDWWLVWWHAVRFGWASVESTVDFAVAGSHSAVAEYDSAEIFVDLVVSSCYHINSHRSEISMMYKKSLDKNRTKI